MQRMHREFRNLEAITSAIKQKTTQYETTTLSKQEEKNITKDLEILKKSIPFAEKNAKLDPEFEQAKKKRREIGERVGELKRDIEAREKEIEEYRHEMDIVNSQRKDVYEKKDELEADIGKIKEKLDEIYK